MTSKTRFATAGWVALMLGISAAADDATQTIHAGALSFQAPKAWKQERPSNAMRKAQIKVDPIKGDTDPSELAVTSFAGGAGTLDANVKRWEGQFEGDDGKTPKAKVETKKGKNVEVTRVEVTGRYVAAMTPGQPGKNDKPNYRLLGAIVNTPEASYYFKLTGPDKTVASTSKDFDAMIESMTMDQ